MASTVDEQESSIQHDRERILNAFRLFDQHKKDYIQKEEVGSVMRYLGAFPSEEALVTQILPQIQDDEDTDLVRLERFLPMMLRVLDVRQYEPDSEDILLQAFQVLDPTNKRYISKAKLEEFLTSNEWAFRPKEMEDFFRFAANDDGNVYYDEYVDKFFENLMN